MSAMGLDAGEREGEESEEESPEDRRKRRSPDAGSDAAAAVQHQTTLGGAPLGSAAVHETASAGMSGSAGSLPHLETIQHSFGAHDVSGVSAHTDGAAASANASMGSEAYASGNSVSFGSSSPSLHTAAHEAAHVVQQRGGISLKGGVGEAGDTHERHADAVADAVVSGQSASSLLDGYASPGASGGSSGGVQHNLIQFDIKADLRTAMSGLGTDEGAIYSRIGRATAPELQAVIADAALLGELKDELTVSEMERALDLLRAPLAMKLRIAMSGWLDDHDYITRSLTAASPDELRACGADATLVTELIAGLSATFLKSCLDRMMVPLARKLDYAMSGWGADLPYIQNAVDLAPIPEVIAVAGDAALMARLETEGWGDIRYRKAQRLNLANLPDEAFKLLVDADDTVMQTRLTAFGNLMLQRALCDAVILAGVDAVRCQRAFHAYWDVQITSAAAAAATADGGDNGAASPAVAARDWPIATLQAIHRALKNIPDQDTRAGIWNTLSLTNDPSLINRAAYGGGDFTVGSNADTTSTVGAGYSCTTTQDSTATSLTCDEPDRFNAGDLLKITGDGHEETFTLSSKSGGVWTVTALTNVYTAGATVQPTDGSATRDVNWLDATVRHEIAHSLDGGGINTQGFYSKGDWTLGDGDAGYDGWIAGMGGTALTPNDASTISDIDKGKIKTAIVDHVTNRKGSLHAAFDADPTHPITVNKTKAVPVIVAAETCLLLGDNFYNSPASMYALNGKRFTISWWYRRFQQHNEAVVSQRVANYGLYSPTEFFAEAYTVFYEERGRPDITDDMLGRLIRNTEWREWIRANVHDRGHAPASGATTPAAPVGGGPAPGSARPGGASTGKASGNPGM